MVSAQFIFTAIVAVVSATSLSAEEEVFAALLKRQSPGTPAYNCHDVCGTAITQSKRGDPCKNDAFKTNYDNCLQCSGPDNFNIWRMYGNTLSAAGSTCGYSTTPLSGKQPDVGPAVRESSSSAGGSAAASATPAPAPATPAPASTSQASRTPAPSVATSSGTGGAIATVPSASRNSTLSATASLPAQQTTNAGVHLGVDAAGVVGAILVGGLLGF